MDEKIDVPLDFGPDEDDEFELPGELQIDSRYNQPYRTQVNANPEDVPLPN